MNALTLLESQHREVEDLFSRLASAEDTDAKEELFTSLADDLAVHSAIEEHHFYPAVRTERTEDLVDESFDEHLEVKRILSSLLDLDVGDAMFDARLSELRRAVLDHVREEEGELFPQVRKLLDDDALESLGRAMATEQAELVAKGSSSRSVPGAADRAASP